MYTFTYIYIYTYIYISHGCNLELDACMREVPSEL